MKWWRQAKGREGGVNDGDLSGWNNAHRVRTKTRGKGRRPAKQQTSKKTKKASFLIWKAKDRNPTKTRRENHKLEKA